MIIEERVNDVNCILYYIEPNSRLSVVGNRLYFHHGDKRTPANLRSDRRWFENSKVHHWISGTTENYIAQLINWIRDNPRLPIRCLEYWNGLGMDGSFNSTELLKKWGYEDTSKVCCVRCKTYPIESIDWYAFDGVVGPCCRKRECYQPGSGKVVGS